MHKLGETWPPEFKNDKLASFEVTRVAGSFMVIALDKDGAAERVLGGVISTKSR